MFNKEYKGPVHGFQLWVNLPAASKMDPPSFQDADPDALPLTTVPGGKIKARRDESNECAPRVHNARHKQIKNSTKIDFLVFII